MTKNEKKALYESIMKQAAVIVNKKLNEDYIDGDLSSDKYDDLSYLRGVGDVQEELQACVGALETENDLIQTREAVISAIKAIYKALVLISMGKKFQTISF